MRANRHFITRIVLSLMLVDVMMTMMTRMNPSACFIGGSSRSNRCISSGSVKAFVTTTTAFSTMTIGSETKRNSANTNTRWTGTWRRTIQVPFYSDGSVFQKAIVGATSSLTHRNLSSSLSNSSNSNRSTKSGIISRDRSRMYLGGILR